MDTESLRRMISEKEDFDFHRKRRVGRDRADWFLGQDIYMHFGLGNSPKRCKILILVPFCGGCMVW